LNDGMIAASARAHHLVIATRMKEISSDSTFHFLQPMFPKTRALSY